MQTEPLDEMNERAAVCKAAHIIELKTKELRRQAIDQSPDHLRERIKYWVNDLWQARQRRKNKNGSNNYR
jgi:hypothetical protein